MKLSRVSDGVKPIEKASKTDLPRPDGEPVAPDGLASV